MEIPSDGGGTISDSGSTTSSKSSRPGPKSPKIQDKVGKPSQERSTTLLSGTKKRKDASPLLDAGKSIAPDKRRRKKTWKRPQVSDRNSGSEIDLDSDKGIISVSETASDSSAARAKRVAKREERAQVDAGSGSWKRTGEYIHLLDRYASIHAAEIMKEILPPS